MNKTLDRFIQDKQINSLQKVWLLLFLLQHADSNAVSPEFARHLNFAVDPGVEEVIDELAAVGLLTQRNGRYMLRDEPEVQQNLKCLAQAYADPLVRQDLLALLYRLPTVRAA